MPVPVLEKKLEENGMFRLFNEIEMPLVFTLYDMEQAGVKVEGEELKRYGEELGARIVELEKEIYEMAGEEFNINSPKQLGVILFEKLEMPYGKKTKTGYSTAADVLDKLAPEYPIVADILEYRQLTKLKSTYADGLANYIRRMEESIIQSDDHGNRKYQQYRTESPEYTDCMELGRLIRKVFVPKEGCVFMDADYSQIELRVLAHIVRMMKLIQAYQRSTGYSPNDSITGIPYTI